MFLLEPSDSWGFDIATCNASMGKLGISHDSQLGDYPCLGTEDSEGFVGAYPATNGATTFTPQGFVCQKRAGLFCDASDNHCKALQPGGGTCTIPDGCDSRACDGGLGSNLPVGTCYPLPGLGEACTLDCAGDTYCDRTTAVRIAKLAAGAACTDNVQCSGTCAGADLCAGSCESGACSPTNGAGGLVLGVWCGVAPVSG